MFDNIASQSSFEDDVLGDGYAFINGQPITLCNGDERGSVRLNGVTYNNQHEILKNLLKTRVSWDSNCAIDKCSNECPNEPRDPLCMLGKNLERERQGVDVWAIISHNA